MALPCAAVDAELDLLPFAGPARINNPRPRFGTGALGRRFQRRSGWAGGGVLAGIATERANTKFCCGSDQRTWGSLPAVGEVAQGVLRHQAGQIGPTQGGDREVDVGEGHPVGEGSQVVDAVAEFPFWVKPKPLSLSPHGLGVEPVGAVGDGLQTPRRRC